MTKQTIVIDISKQTIWRVLAVIGAIIAIQKLESLIFYLLFALLFSVALSPLITWLQTKGMKRNAALVVSLLLLVGGVFSLFGVIIVSLVDSITSFASDLPLYIENLRQYEFAADYVDGAKDAVANIDVDTILRNGVNSGSTLLAGASKAFEAVLFTFFFTVYMLLEKDYLMRVVRSLVPKKYKGKTGDIENEFREVVGNYIRGQLLTSFLMGLISYLIFRILGIPNALALGIIAGMTDVIPVVGGLLGLIPATLVAITISPLTAILCIILVQSYSTLSNYFVRPKIFGKALSMSPFIVTVATMVGLLIFGIPGIIFALPAASMFSYVLTKYYGVPLMGKTMLEFSEALAVGAVTAFVFMNLAYLMSMFKKDTSIVDIGWGFGFVLIAASICLKTDEPTAVMRLTQVLVAVWGLRLFLHILSRKAGHGEDWRYKKWRDDWGANHWWRSYLQVFILQGSIMTLIAMPLYIVASANNAVMSPLVYLGAALWLLGFYFEAVGDWQLKKFIQNRSKKSKKSKNSVMQTGLWRYTRHPNYFGEVTQWWGLFVIVMSQQNGLIGIVSPIIITYLLLKVSGITMLEKKFEDNKEFQKYKKRTSAFIPMPPKNGK